MAKLRLVKTREDAELLRSEYECDEAFFHWQDAVMEIDDRWDQIVELDDKNHLDESFLEMFELIKLQSEAIKCWHEYVRKRRNLIDMKGRNKLSGE